jgi:hypothetical protein
MLDGLTSRYDPGLVGCVERLSDLDTDIDDIVDGQGAAITENVRV